MGSSTGSGANAGLVALAGRIRAWLARLPGVPLPPEGTVRPARQGPCGRDWREAIWRGRVPYPRRSGSPPPLRPNGRGTKQ